MLDKKLAKKLNDLAPWQELAFIAALAERALPNYVLFTEACQFGNAKQYRQSLDLFWEWLTVKGAKINFEVQQERFEPIIPEPANFDSYGVYPAMDACVILNSGFILLMQKSKGEASNASQVSLGTVAGFIELMAGEECSDAQLLEEELMQIELEFQHQVLDAMGDQRSPELIKQLKKLAQNDGISNIGIGLD